MTFNERSRLDPLLHASILSVGNGDKKDIYDSLDPRIQIFTEEERAMKWLYEDGDPYNPITTKNRAMLCSYNADVDAHNAMARSRMVALGAAETECLSSDSYRFDGLDTLSATTTGSEKLPDDFEAAHEKDLRDLEIRHAARECADASPDGLHAHDFADVCFDLNTVFEEQRGLSIFRLNI